MEFWSANIIDGALAVDHPYTHWVVGRAYMKPSDDIALSGEDPQLPSFEGWSNQNRNWGDGPVGDWPFPSDRVWQYARVDTLPDLSPGFVAVI